MKGSRAYSGKKQIVVSSVLDPWILIHRDHEVSTGLLEVELVRENWFRFVGDILLVLERHVRADLGQLDKYVRREMSSGLQPAQRFHYLRQVQDCQMAS